MEESQSNALAFLVIRNVKCSQKQVKHITPRTDQIASDSLELTSYVDGRESKEHESLAGQ